MSASINVYIKTDAPEKVQGMPGLKMDKGMKYFALRLDEDLPDGVMDDMVSRMTLRANFPMTPRYELGRYRNDETDPYFKAVLDVIIQSENYYELLIESCQDGATLESLFEFYYSIRARMIPPFESWETAEESDPLKLIHTVTDIRNDENSWTIQLVTENVEAGVRKTVIMQSLEADKTRVLEAVGKLPLKTLMWAVIRRKSLAEAFQRYKRDELAKEYSH